MIALSPPRLAYSFFHAQEPNGAFHADFKTAQALIAAGTPDALFEARFPHPDLTSARTFDDKYGTAERYNLLKFLPRLSCPALVLLGALEERNLPLARGLAKDLKALAKGQPGLVVDVVPGANQFYSNVREKAVLAIDAWLRADKAWPVPGADETAA